MTSNGDRIPYSDPDYPSFILIAPLCLVYVPTPSTELVLYYSCPLDMDDEEIGEGLDIEFCQICGNAF